MIPWELKLSTILSQMETTLNNYKLKQVDLEALACHLLKHEDLKEYCTKHSIDREKLQEELWTHVIDTAEKDLYTTRSIVNSDEVNFVYIRAERAATILNSPYITCTMILRGILGSYNSFASAMLRKYGVDEQSLHLFTNAKIKDQFKDDIQRLYIVANEIRMKNEDNSTGVRMTLNETPPFCYNMCTEALKGQYDSLIGRKDELASIIETLNRRRKNNPLLVGDSGVGKTILVEGLAKKIALGEVPDSLKDSVIFRLDTLAINSGTKYRGDFEKNVSEMIEGLTKVPNSILFIDEIHLISKLGGCNTSEGLGELLKPLLTSKKICLIGATTVEEYRSIFQKEKALDRRFNKIDINEPSMDDTIEILTRAKKDYEVHHKIVYDKSAIESAVRLSNHYIRNKVLPDKAIDLLDRAGAHINTLKVKPTNLTSKHIEETLAKTLNIDKKFFHRDLKRSLTDLSTNLLHTVFGQDEAVKEVLNLVKLAKTKLRVNTKPLANLMFVGPTGVGKTELAKQLSTHLGLAFCRFDMSEYTEEYSISKLIGSAPGYVGYSEGGRLTEAINKHPHSVLLLDEIEKAHPSILNLLLQIMDHGTLTDGNGRIVDFKHVILIMTSNAGIKEGEKTKVGFLDSEHPNDFTIDISSYFSPEFRNRLDKIIKFKYLEKKDLRFIVTKNVQNILSQIKDYKVTITSTERITDYLLEKGYNKTMGARPLETLIQDTLSLRLADMIVNKELKKKANLIFDYKDNEVILKCLD